MARQTSPPPFMANVILNFHFFGTLPLVKTPLAVNQITPDLTIRGCLPSKTISLKTNEKHPAEQREKSK